MSKKDFYRPKAFEKEMRTYKKNKSCTEAFYALKKSIESAKIRKALNWSKMFCVLLDAFHVSSARHLHNLMMKEERRLHLFSARSLLFRNKILQQIKKKY